LDSATRRRMQVPPSLFIEPEPACPSRPCSPSVIFNLYSRISVTSYALLTLPAPQFQKISTCLRGKKSQPWRADCALPPKTFSAALPPALFSPFHTLRCSVQHAQRRRLAQRPGVRLRLRQGRHARAAHQQLVCKRSHTPCVRFPCHEPTFPPRAASCPRSSAGLGTKAASPSSFSFQLMSLLRFMKRKRLNFPSSPTQRLHMYQTPPRPCKRA
jgi:hypothetical protein